MRKLSVFNNVSLDGYFTDSKSDMSWAHRDDPDWREFASGNASGDTMLMLGRKTYDQMAGFWTTPMALETMPLVAKGMKALPKMVFSRTMERASWNNTQLVKNDIVAEVRNLKNKPGPDITILGSGSIVAQLATEGLIDTFQFAVIPIVLGSGRTLFEGVKEKIPLKLTNSRAFSNGNIVLWYQS